MTALSKKDSHRTVYMGIGLYKCNIHYPKGISFLLKRPVCGIYWVGNWATWYFSIYRQWAIGSEAPWIHSDLLWLDWPGKTILCFPSSGDTAGHIIHFAPLLPVWRTPNAGAASLKHWFGWRWRTAPPGSVYSYGLREYFCSAQLFCFDQFSLHFPKANDTNTFNS